jgi:hypothetical protein
MKARILYKEARDAVLSTSALCLGCFKERLEVERGRSFGMKRVIDGRAGVTLGIEQYEAHNPGMLVLGSLGGNIG